MGTFVACLSVSSFRTAASLLSALRLLTLAFDAGHHNPLDEVSLGDKEKDYTRQDGDKRRRHQQVPGGRAVAMTESC